jgi:proteasome accessory factor C
MNERLRRLLLVVPAARARPGIALADLARDLAADPEELRRDISLLACVGGPPFLPDDLIDIELRDDRVWVSLPQAFARPMRLLWTEAAALAVAARSLSPGDPLVQSAVDKLRRAVASTQRELFDAALSRVPANPPDTAKDVEATLAHGIRERRVVEIVYYAAGEWTAQPRLVRPRAIATANGVRYLAALKEDGAERQYRIDRITRAALRPDTFAPLPPFDLKAAMARIAAFESQPDLPRAKVRFAPGVVAAARARHPDARRRKDGSVEVDLAYSTLPWLVSYALSWGGQAILESPPEARAAMLERVEKALKASS